MPVAELGVPVPWGARERGACVPAPHDTVGPQVNVGEGSHPGRVKVHGPGVEKTGLKANEPTYFTVDCSEAGQGGCCGGRHLGKSPVGMRPVSPVLHPWSWAIITSSAPSSLDQGSFILAPSVLVLVLHLCSWSIVPAPGPGFLGLHPYSCTCTPGPLSLILVHQP